MMMNRPNSISKINQMTHLGRRLKKALKSWFDGYFIYSQPVRGTPVTLVAEQSWVGCAIQRLADGANRKEISCQPFSVQLGGASAARPIVRHGGRQVIPDIRDAGGMGRVGA